ncbi:MAG: hypothetical protein GEU76_03895 [Alphaproteobacteria bacterium]|nr:hypothetical protein [Alphaproteobacteria bacterium]
MSQLVKYDAACRAIAEAKSVDEVKDVRDKADAMRCYAHQAKNRQLEIDAAEIRMRAERKLGELITAQKETVGLNTGARGIGTSAVPKENRTPTLAEAGIDKKLSSRAQKMAAVPEDKFEGMLGVWRDVVRLGALKAISGQMAVIKFDVAADEAAKNPQFRKVFEIIGKVLPAGKLPDIAAREERPFLSPMAWAYFSAYLAVLLHAYTRLKALEMGLEDSKNLLNDKYANDLLKTALPHQASYIDQHGAVGHHYLLDELEDNILRELREMLEGASADDEALNHAASIIDRAKTLTDRNETQLAKAGGESGAAPS